MSAGEFRSSERTLPQDWAKLSAYLSGAGFAFDAARQPLQFAGGFGNLNYLLEVSGRQMVLRRPPFGPIPPGANDMAREHRVLSALNPAFRLAPQPEHLCLDPVVLGAPFLLLEYRPGLIIRDVLPEGMSAEGVGPHISKTLLDTMVRLHAIDPFAIGLSTLGRPEGFLSRTIAGWAVRAALAVDGVVLVSPTEELVGWLRRNVVADSFGTLLHNDFKLDNIVFDPVTLAPRAVLDWDMGSRGDPLFDLATMLSYWTEPGDPAPLQEIRQMPTAAPGFATRAQVIRAYSEATGRDVSNFKFYRVLTMFKLGVVFLQLGAQWRRGTRTNPRFATFDALGADLLSIAHDIARGRMD
jgi:aminoglycoside phosphotransferase (APT) family kinase protein